jgi:hypothetical protein
VYCFDVGYVIKKLQSEVLGHDLPLDGYTDSRTVFNTIAKLDHTMEKRLQIDASGLRESHAWVNSEHWHGHPAMRILRRR